MSVRISEEDFDSMQIGSLLKRLPSNATEVHQMRYHSCAVSEMFFGSDDSHLRCLYLSAAVQLAADIANGLVRNDEEESVKSQSREIDRMHLKLLQAKYPELRPKPSVDKAN